MNADSLPSTYTPWRLQLSRLELKPGEILVVKVDERLSSTSTELMADQIRQFMQSAGLKNRCLIVSQTTTVSAVAPGEVPQ